MTEKEIGKILSELVICGERFKGIFYSIDLHPDRKERIELQGDYENVIKVFPKLKFHYEVNTSKFYDEYLKIGNFDFRIIAVKNKRKEKK